MSHIGSEVRKSNMLIDHYKKLHMYSRLFMLNGFVSLFGLVYSLLYLQIEPFQVVMGFATVISFGLFFMFCFFAEDFVKKYKDDF